jgi:hypothetical protein
MKDDAVRQADREFAHRGFLRSRAEARRKGKKHKQVRTTSEILSGRREGRTQSAKGAGVSWGLGSHK